MIMIKKLVGHASFGRLHNVSFYKDPAYDRPRNIRLLCAAIC